MDARPSSRPDPDAPGRAPVRIVFVCLGNICRSPMAAAVLRQRLEAAGTSHLVVVDSAGTGDWHSGQGADDRARAALHRRGYDDHHVARQFAVQDFADFDLVLAADASNVADLRDLAPTPEAAAKVRLLRSFDPDSPDDAEVPDPYYGGDGGFDQVLDLIEAACDGILDDLDLGV